MATTQKGIYYPDDYTAIADVPEDMKDLAESVDTALDTKVDKEEGKGLSTYNFGTVSKGRLDSLWNNKGNIESDIARIKATLPTTTGSGENITLQNTAELDFIQPPLPRGNSEQVQYSGKNLFDDSVKNNMWVLTNGNISTISDGANIKRVNCSAGDSYTISATFSNVASNSILLIAFFDANDTLLRRNVVNANASLSLSKTAPANTAYMYAGHYVIVPTTIQLEQGSTATSYEPYVGGIASPNPSYPQAITNVTGDVEVLVQNKNLFDKNNANIINGYFTTTANITSNENHRTIYIPVKSNTTYTIQKSNAGGDNSRFGIGTTAELPTVGTAVSQVTINNSATSLAITTNATAKYLVVWCYFTSNTAITELNLLSTIQIEVGSTATTYTPHQEQTFTFPLGTQRMYLGDYLADDGIHHVRGQVVFDGIENWITHSYGTNSYSLQNIINCIFNSAKVQIISNYFKGVSNNDRTSGNNIIYTISNNEFVIRNTEFTSLADFKTWLGTHNLIVEYELATEEITPYTTEQQQVYDEIKQALSYEEQTNISGTSDESNPLFSVEAYQSIKLILAS